MFQSQMWFIQVYKHKRQCLVQEHDPSELSHRVVFCTGGGNKHQSSRGQNKAHQSVQSVRFQGGKAHLRQQLERHQTVQLRLTPPSCNTQTAACDWVVLRFFRWCPRTQQLLNRIFCSWRHLRLHTCEDHVWGLIVLRVQFILYQFKKNAATATGVKIKSLITELINGYQ